MLDYFRKLFDGQALAPHGFCLLWQPELVWTHVLSDTVIALSYFSIPIVIAVLLIKRRDIQFGWAIWMFAIFIMACGTTHVMAIWTLWHADYGIEAAIKVVTAIASLFTAAALWPLLPRAIALPSPAQLQLVNADLRLRISERDAALTALEQETAERLRAEEMLRQSQKMEAVGQLTGGIAHDFNNLLTVIISSIERAQRLGTGSDPKATRSLDTAMVAAERAGVLTHQLLAFSRRQTLQPAGHDINTVVAAVAELASRTLGPNIEVGLDLADNLPPVFVDSAQMDNALLNLLFNARDAMPDGGTIMIRTRIESGEADAGSDASRSIAIEVIDTGAGMSEETMVRAFEPFFTTKPLGQGTGLGLSQVYGFVNQSEGRVELDSIAGKGTTVRIILPGVREA